MAINVTSPGGLTGGRKFMGQQYSDRRVGSSDVVLEAQKILDDPTSYAANQGMLVGQQVPFMDSNAGGTQGTQVNYGSTNQFNTTAATGTTAAGANLMPEAPTAQTGYNSASVTNAINETGTSANASTATASSGSLVDVDETQMSLEGDAATDSLNDVAMYNTSNVLDTSTIAGKLVARDLGEFGFVDSKRTVVGQLDLLQKHFVDPNTGEYKIPGFMADMANSIKGSLNIKGADSQQITAKLATAMMSNLVGIADKEANIMNGIASENMTAKNAQFMQKARILSQLKIANADAKTQALTYNATVVKNLDLANLANQQQAGMLNASQRYLALFEDAKETNLGKRFDITNELDREQWYTTLSTNTGLAISQMKDAFEKFNLGEVNATARANQAAEMRMFEFEKTHQHQIDQDNVAWRRQVMNTNTQMAFSAAQMDAKTILGITSEQHNRLWNRADMQFNYLATSSESQKDRDLKMFQMKMEAQMAAMKAKASKKNALFGAIGQIGGSVLGSMFGAGGMFGASTAAATGTTAAVTGGSGFMATMASFLPFLSDPDLKTNIRRIGTHSSGLALYKWDWNDTAKKLGAGSQNNVGIMADEAKEKFPHAVHVHPNGYLAVRYERLQ
jgi:hypothetical protein